MRSAVLRWFDQAAVAVRELMDRPWSLFFVLLAVNAVAQPYRGIVHDSQLYATQVVNRVQGGAYNDDLYFRYGSQDRYSLFSVVAAPVVGLLGIQVGFFVLYLAINSLMMLAIQRLSLTLLKNRLVVALSLLFLAATPLSYAGLDCLHINECFVTPRALGIALAVFGLDQMLKARYKTALGLLVGAGLMHPLMTVGGVLAFAGWWMVERLGWRRTLLVCAPLAVAVAAVLAYRPLGARMFGTIDDEWREYTRRACPMNFLTEWNPGDWVQLIVGLAMTFGLVLYHPPEDRRLARFAAVVGVVSLLAVFGTFLVCWLPYALPFQAQPYRALWLLAMLQAPFGIQLALNLWRSPSRLAKWPALAVAAWFGLAFFSPVDAPLLRLAVVLIGFAYFWMRLSETPAPAWLLRAVGTALVVSAGIWTLMRFPLFLGMAPAALEVLSAVDYFTFLTACLGIFGWAALCLTSVLMAKRLLGLGWRLRLAAFSVCLAAQTAAFFAIVANVWDIPCHRSTDMQFVNRFLETHSRGDGRLATVYCPPGDIGDVWLTARAKSWFNRYQLAGNLFNRQTAMEGQRRARIVRPFELQRVRRFSTFMSEQVLKNQEDLYEAPLTFKSPTVVDLANVCAEDGVDYVVLPNPFNVPRAADNGRVYIYDCRQVRAALGGRAAEIAVRATERTPKDSVASSKLP